MGTRSTIALEFADGTVGQVYCHWDGYLNYNGRILQEHYTDPFKLRDLIDAGDISSLGASVGEKHGFDERVDAETLAETVCTFYGRDRGEEGVSARYFKDFADYRYNHQYEEYEYILRSNGVWYVCQNGNNYVPLGEALVVEAVA